jgi:hypothetical protein
MTEQERQLISNLADRIRNAPPTQIDRDAYDLILHTIGTRPDALYMLTQIVLLQEMALNHAQSQGSFLRQQQPAPAYQEPRYQESRYQESSYASPPPPPPQQTGGFSGFLHNAAQTAAGVIAGEIAFDSLSSLFGHRGGGFFGGGGGGFLGGGGYGSETIINNYGDERGSDRGDDTRFADAASQDQGVSSDIDDERDNSGDNFVDDGSSFDDSGDGGSSDN